MVIKGTITHAAMSWPEAVPKLGTNVNPIAPNSPTYGSFGKTNLKADEQYKKSSDKKDTVDNDSGMSSEETDDSLKYDASATNNISIDKQPEVITKCLTNEPQRAQHWNEIPCCSNNNVSVNDTTRLKDDQGTDKVTEFIVIDLTCDVGNVSEANVVENSTNSTNDNCDNLIIPSLDESQSLVPVNNEIMRTDSQKLVSLSLSILLAALLQAMRCFAQFLEDIVVPQR